MQGGGRSQRAEAKEKRLRRIALFDDQISSGTFNHVEREREREMNTVVGIIV